MTGLGLSFRPYLGPHRSLLNLPLPLPACQNPQHPPAPRECIPLGVWTGGSSLHFTDSLQVFLIPWVTTSALSHLCPPLQDTPTPLHTTGINPKLLRPSQTPPYPGQEIPDVSRTPPAIFLATFPLPVLTLAPAVPKVAWPCHQSLGGWAIFNLQGHTTHKSEETPEPALETC